MNHKKIVLTSVFSFIFCLLISGVAFADTFIPVVDFSYDKSKAHFDTSMTHGEFEKALRNTVTPNKKEALADDSLVYYIDIGNVFLDYQDEKYGLIYGTGDKTDEKLNADTIYYIGALIKAKDGYSISENTQVMMDGKQISYKKDYNESNGSLKVNIYLGKPSKTLVKVEEANKGEDIKAEDETPKKVKEEEKVIKNAPLDKVEIKVDEPELGEYLAKTCLMKTNLDKDFVEYVCNDSNIDISWEWYPGNPYIKAEGDSVYGFRMVIRTTNLDYTLSDDLTVIINGEEFEDYYVERGAIVIEKDYKTEVDPEVEAKTIREFAFTVTEPKAGEVPATTAKAVNNGYKVTKVVWTPNDAKFSGGKEYKVEIFFELESKDHIIEYGAKTTINKKEAIQQGEKAGGILMIDQLCAEYTFPKLEGEPEETPQEPTKKVTWEKASNWAVEELNKANEEELIPEIFEQEDLTKDVTRKEFAHVAVKLFENLTGKEAPKPANNPFTDTSDEEVLKAYQIGITAGTSETTFSPDSLITREQMATMMARALSKANIDISVDLNSVEKFADDAEISSWAKESVYYMSNIGIIKGVGDNAFGVKGNATKEQSILISSRSVDSTK